MLSIRLFWATLAAQRRCFFLVLEFVFKDNFEIVVIIEFGFTFWSKNILFLLLTIFSVLVYNFLASKKRIL